MIDLLLLSLKHKQKKDKYVTYLLHRVAVGIRVKWRKGAEIGQTIGLGSDDF